MKLKGLLLGLFILSSVVGWAQRPGGPPSKEQFEKLRAMKVGMITQKISLTEEQAKSFWPIYDQYDAEKRKLTQDLRNKLRESRGQRNENNELARQDEVFKLREKELALAKSYRPRFLNVISAKQYSDLLLAEREFNQMILRELRERRNTRD